MNAPQRIASAARRIAAVWGIVAVCGIAGCATAGHPAASGAAATASAPTGCVTHTGNRLPDDNGCTGPGNAYSQTDLRNTGQTTVPGALSELDPALTLHR